MKNEPFLRTCSAREAASLLEQELDQITPVGELIDTVRRQGDAGVRALCARFGDGVPESLLLLPGPPGFCPDPEAVPEGVRAALLLARDRLQAFARLQRRQLSDFSWPLGEGLVARQRVEPLERVGIYVPGGRYPLVSSVLMGAVPAREAGVGHLLLASPLPPSGHYDPAFLLAADLAGVDAILCAGGVQAVAALALGTESVAPVDFIAGPGNRWVTAAKQALAGRVGMDMVAGPTEVWILASEEARPDWVAADLLAQAEHDPLARAVLLSPSPRLLEAVREACLCQLKTLPTAAVAGVSLRERGLAVLLRDWEEGVALCNRFAPEHLELQGPEAEALCGRLRHYGSLFVGGACAESLGDYCAGINHTLPTGGQGRIRGGLSVLDFLKVHTQLEGREASRDPQTYRLAANLARAEGLEGHARSLLIRLGGE